ncbi:MAG TPA: outer membrane protein assembly factor BamE [Telluria sp.]|nr:outer membrane protein assembly factor BamE [Telluria sp.]
MLKLPMLAAAALLAGCAAMTGPLALPGDSMETVRSRMGTPTEVRTVPSGTIYEYGAGMFGQQAWIARFDTGGRLLSVTQVRTGDVFATLRPGVATKADVLDTLGRPSETSRVHLGNFEVWSYRYKENNVWNSMMHVHFDQAGVVRLMQSGPDPMYEDKRPF